MIMIPTCYDVLHNNDTNSPYIVQLVHCTQWVHTLVSRHEDEVDVDEIAHDPVLKTIHQI